MMAGMTGPPGADAGQTGGRAATLRPATVADAALLAALHGEILGQDWSADSVARLLALPGAFALLAVAAGGGPGPDMDGKPGGDVERTPGGGNDGAETPAGFGLCIPAGDGADLAAIGVRTAFRRAGVGRRLLAGLQDGAAARGFTRMTLEVAASNDAAIGLYRTAGFSGTGRRPGYYRQGRGGVEDAVVMTWRRTN